eukprot:TRINITY_DN15958_c0_g1_i1.p1 TRINITY_DN15958_c0_g1~~TRINITY_DN15958_c0_g1_i1.p1  ORF type:complete len:428 (+),score=127.30 TRINITY_DN15958_c0_g1_i1:79-1362(+)
MPGRPKSFGIAGLMAQPDPAVAAAAITRGAPAQPQGERRANPGLDKAMDERRLAFVERGGERVEVGRGAFATAYLATDVAGRELVIKEVDLTKLSQRDRHKAGQEVTFLRGFTHVNVVRCLDAFNTYNTLHIVLEYASQGTLQARIETAQKQGPFDVAQVLRWFAEISAALDHLHSARVLHRDLKTANVFLDKDLRVKLGDFGMSRKLDDEDNLSGGQVGTPYYFAPEVCRKCPYSNKTDIWSAGVVLYELARLRRPFEAKSMRGLLKAIQEASYAALPEDTDPRVAGLIRSILVTQQRERPSAAKLCQHPDLACFLPRHEAAASPPVRRLLVSAKKREPGKRSGAVRRWVLNVAGLAKAGSCPPAAGSPGSAHDDGYDDDDFEAPTDEDEDDYFQDDYDDDFEPDIGDEEDEEIRGLTEVQTDTDY